MARALITHEEPRVHTTCLARHYFTNARVAKCSIYYFRYYR